MVVARLIKGVVLLNTVNQSDSHGRCPYKRHSLRSLGGKLAILILVYDDGEDGALVGHGGDEAAGGGGGVGEHLRVERETGLGGNAASVGHGEDFLDRGERRSGGLCTGEKCAACCICSVFEHIF